MIAYLYRAAAEAVVLVHLLFVAFALFGAFLVLRWRRVAWLHLPAMLWAAAIEFGGWICPLTPLENRLRALAGAATYNVSFVERYLLPVLYPENLPRRLQILLGVLVLAMNLAIYAWVLRRGRHRDRI